MPWLVVSAALAALYGAEKIGDWWNAENGLATVPVTPPALGNTPQAPGAVVTLGAAALTAAGVAWWMTRGRK